MCAASRSSVNSAKWRCQMPFEEEVVMCIVEVLAVSLVVRKRQLELVLVAALNFSQCISNKILQFIPKAHDFFYYYLFAIRYTLFTLFTLFVFRYSLFVLLQ